MSVVNAVGPNFVSLPKHTS
jgi:hypothetical protein